MVAVTFSLDDKVFGLARHLEFVVGVAGTPRPYPARGGVDDGAVPVHQRDVRLQCSLRERVVDTAVKPNLLLCRRVFLFSRLCYIGTIDNDDLLSL